MSYLALFSISSSRNSPSPKCRPAFLTPPKANVWNDNNSSKTLKLSFIPKPNWNCLYRNELSIPLGENSIAAVNINNYCPEYSSTCNVKTIHFECLIIHLLTCRSTYTYCAPSTWYLYMINNPISKIKAKFFNFGMYVMNVFIR